MEMDSSRRPFDRSREPGLKKPRLAAEEPSGRPFSLRTTSASPNQVQSKYDRDTDSNDPSRGGGGYQPQPLPPHQQHQELIEQYRTALSELTFNSKPIITNLTIIAGENLHAAKAIASTICVHILEVPSDQKLPSLYLLDSIVKNIGRDYIKYFATRLPEVFCKAYKQVDGPIHSSMRHLFGTWKGVFHPQVLQSIEKELGFGSPANGSSAPATSRPESLSQRPPHSIHVNPKYLERQRLQQSARPKGMANDIDGALINSSEDVERLERPTGVTTGRTWAGPTVKRSQRDPRIDPLQDKNSAGVLYGDLEYGSDIPRNSGSGLGKGGGKVTKQKAWIGAASGGVADVVPIQRNGIPAKHKLQSYPPPKSSSIEAQLSRSAGGLSTNWKNSEEEEFLWDSMDSRTTDHDSTVNISTIPRRDHWTSDVSEKLDFENNLPKTLSREGRNHIGILGTPNRSGLSDGYAATRSGVTTSGSVISRTGIGSQVTQSSGFLAASSVATGQQRIQPLGPPSPSAQSPMHPHSPVDVSRHPQTDIKTSQFLAKSNLGLNNQCDEDSLPVPSKVQSGILKRPQPHESKAAPPPVTSFQSRQSPQISQPISGQVPQRQVLRPVRDSLPENSPPLTLETSSQLSLSTSSLLAAIAKSGGLPMNATVASLPAIGSQDKEDASHASSRALHAGPATSHDFAAPDASQGKIPKSEPEAVPISSLLSSLVAKGLISASKSDTPPRVPPKTPLLDVKQEAISATPEATSSALVSAKLPASAGDEVSVPEPLAESSDSPRPLAAAEEIKNLIGFEFKPEIIRKFHPCVIDDLFDELPHRCCICGLRLKLQDTLDRHVIRHGSQDRDQRGAANASDRWYACSTDWIAGRTGRHVCGAESVKLEVEEERCNETIGEVELMVPADESQCACVLCGELFEDFYDIGKDEWMFRGATYVSVPYKPLTPDGESDSNSRGPIVHAHCLSEEISQDLGLDNGVKMEEDA